jgi:hypothetical protein
VLEAILFVSMVLWTAGFVFGLRPSRQFPPTRMLIVLLVWSLPVLMAGWVIFDSNCFAWARWLLDDREGIAVAVIAELMIVVGTVLLLPAWGYAIGRTVNWFRSSARSRLTAKFSTAREWSTGRRALH